MLFGYYIYDDSESYTNKSIVYYITVNGILWSDCDIVELIKMSRKEYQELSSKYGAIINKRKGHTLYRYFLLLQKVKEFVENLNDKYSVMITLTM